MTGDTDWMSLGEWVVALRDLHHQARLGKLPEDELRRYREERDTLARAILASQRLRATPGARGRKALRVARGLKVDVVVNGVRTESRTLDLGIGGLAVMLDAPLHVKQEAELRLELERDTTIAIRARVVSVQRKGKPYRVAFTFEELPAADAERIGMAIFEAALAGIMPREG